MSNSQANITRTNHVMWTMGTDFKYQFAHTWYRNMDKLIHYVNKVSVSSLLHNCLFLSEITWDSIFTFNFCFFISSIFCYYYYPVKSFYILLHCNLHRVEYHFLLPTGWACKCSLFDPIHIHWCKVCSKESMATQDWRFLSVSLMRSWTLLLLHLLFYVVLKLKHLWLQVCWSCKCLLDGILYKQSSS